MRKELLLMAGDQMNGVYRVTVGKIQTEDFISYGWSGVSHVGELKPQNIGRFPIDSISTSSYDMTTIVFVKNPAINFSSITVTRMDNQRSTSLVVLTQGEIYVAIRQRFFQEEDVGKTIDLIIEAT